MVYYEVNFIVPETKIALKRRARINAVDAAHIFVGTIIRHYGFYLGPILIPKPSATGLKWLCSVIEQTDN